MSNLLQTLKNLKPGESTVIGPCTITVRLDGKFYGYRRYHLEDSFEVSTAEEVLGEMWLQPTSNELRSVDSMVGFASPNPDLLNRLLGMEIDSVDWVGSIPVVPRPDGTFSTYKDKEEVSFQNAESAAVFLYSQLESPPEYPQVCPQVWGRATRPTEATCPPPYGYVNTDGLAKLCQDIHRYNVDAGWWTNIETGERLDRNVPEMLMLIVSEISEAMEGYRKNLMDDKLPHRKMIEVELADAVIRICDTAEGLGLDLAGAVREKIIFNTSRPDHKIENRLKENGKKF